jgi:mRNA interferase MazF
VTAGYQPHEGDLIWVGFDPRIGREQAGRRPVLVLSHRKFFVASGFVIPDRLPRPGRALLRKR